MMMKSIAIGVLFALIPFAVSFLLYRRGKCSVWTVFVSLLIGLFSYFVLVMILVFLSGGCEGQLPAESSFCAGVPRHNQHRTKQSGDRIL